MKQFLLSLLAIFYFSTSVAQDGTYDPTFSSPFAFNDGDFRALKITDDDKVLLGGHSTWDGLEPVLQRLNADGTYDTTFGTAGFAQFNFTTQYVYDIEIYNGSIYALCQTIQGTPNIMYLVRFSLNGVIDLTFGTDGRVSITNARGNDLTVQPDGKFVIAGSKLSGTSQWVPAIYRLNEDGTTDTAFGSSGQYLPPITGSFYNVILDQNDNIYAAANTGICKLTPQGQPFAGFASNGILHATTSFTSIKAIALADDGKIIAGARYETTSPATQRAAVYRFNTNGGIDMSFGTDGRTVVNLEYTQSSLNDIIIQNDGKILMFTTVYIPDAYRPYGSIYRILPAGGLDTSFSVNGGTMLHVPYFIFEAYHHKIQLQSTGSIIVCGNYDYSPYVQRYLNNTTAGTIDFSKGSDTYVYPNPLTESSVLEYTLANPETLSIELIDINGRVLKTYTSNQEQPAGLYRQNLNSDDLPSGTYFITLTSPKGKIMVKAIK